MALRPTKKAVVAVTAAVVLGAAAAAAFAAWRNGSLPVTQGRGQTTSQTESEYRVEAAQLVLAPGWVWPATPGFPAKGPDGAPMTYERGYGRTRADSLWFCSWATAYLSPGTSSAQRSVAASELEQATSTFFYRVALVPPDRPGFSAMVSTAIRGRESALRSYVRLNCPVRKVVAG